MKAHAHPCNIATKATIPAMAHPSGRTVELAPEGRGEASVRGSLSSAAFNTAGTTGHSIGHLSTFSRAPLSIQPKLKINQPGDKYEQEADRVADMVMRMPEPSVQRKCSCGGGGCSKCKGEHSDGEHELLQMKRVDASSLGPDEAPPIVHEVLRRSGQGMDAGTRRNMEQRFGHDFRAVRIHTDAEAQRSTRALHAHAYATGTNIVFGAGRYAPGSREGDRLLAHELTHVVQASGSRLIVAGTGIAIRSSAAIIARYPSIDEERVQNEVDRREFTDRQTEWFADIGALIREQLMQRIGASPRSGAVTLDQALKIIGLWGSSIEALVADVRQLDFSLSTSLRGSHDTTSLDIQQQALIGSLSTIGKNTYKDVLANVRSESFWRTYLDRTTTYIFPDLSGQNRYSGYTQRATAQVPGGPAEPAFIIHISKDRLEAGEVDASAATLVHELSHTLYEPTLIASSIGPLNAELSDVLVDHASISALRTAAPDPAVAREQQKRKIKQALFEMTGYGEAEIFVHLQQLPYQPDEIVNGERIRGTDRILDTVELYLRKLMRIGLPPRMLNGVLDSLARRAMLLYERRIEAEPIGSTARRVMELKRDQARLLFQIARDQAAEERPAVAP